MTTRSPDLISGKAIFRIGLGLVIGAFAYFLRYAIENGWLGPLAQLSLAAGGGLAMIVVGEQLLRSRRVYGGLLQGGGGAVIYLTAFAAHHRLDVLGSAEAAVSLALISAGVVGLAYRNRQEALAVVGLAGAVTAPLILGSGFDAITLTAVTATASYLYVDRAWRLVFYTSGVLLTITVSIAALGLFWERPPDAALAIGTGLMVVGLWAAALGVAARRPEHALDAAVTPVLASVSLPLLGYAVGSSMVSVTGRMILALVIAATCVVALLVLRQTTALSIVAEVQMVPATLLAALAWFDGFGLQTALIVMTVQAGAMVVTGARFQQRMLLGLGYAGLGILVVSWAGRAVLASDSVFDVADLATLTTVVVLAATGLLIRSSEDEVTRASSTVFRGMALAMAILWPVLSLEPVATGLLTAAWAAVGVATTALGKTRSSTLVRNTGLALLVLTVIKLLVVDTAAVAPLGRMGLFAGIGLALLGVGMWLGDDDERLQTTEEAPSKSALVH